MRLKAVMLPRLAATLACPDLCSTGGVTPIESTVEDGLRCKKPIANSHPNQTPDEIVEKILYLRRSLEYHLGPVRIMWYMARYHQMRVSDATIYRVLKRHGVNRLPGTVGRRKVHTKRYSKQVPGHHIQMEGVLEILCQSFNLYARRIDQWQRSLILKQR